MQWHSSEELQFRADGKHCVDFSSDLLLQLVCYDFPLGHRLTPSYHDYFEICYILYGKGIMHIENESLAVTEGNVIPIGTTPMHRLTNVETYPLKTICLYFMPEFIGTGGTAAVSDYLPLFTMRPIRINQHHYIYSDHNKRVYQLLATIDDELTRQNAYYRQAVRIHLSHLLLLLLRTYTHHVPVGKQDKAQQWYGIERLKAVFTYIQEHFQEPIVNAQLARAACMSPSYFCRFFKQTTGMTATEYILRVRIDTAKQLLLQSDLNVTQIAYRIGFTNHSYFDRVFQRLTALTPSAFRTRFRDENRLMTR